MLYSTVVADPPWPEKGPMYLPAPTRDVPDLPTPFQQMSYVEISALPVGRVCADQAHLYLWVPLSGFRRAVSALACWSNPVV